MNYWNQRKDLPYYKRVLELAKKYVPDGYSVIDVGSHDCRYIEWFDWFKRRTVLDILEHKVEIPGMEYVQTDFMKYRITGFDLVLCLQVLEHIPDAEKFAKKLLETGNTVIASVPYKWDPKIEPEHVHDPVDEEKLLAWFGKPWVEADIVNHRLIAVFQ